MNPSIRAQVTKSDIRRPDDDSVTIVRYYNNTFDVRGHKYVFGPTQNSFLPRVARAKMNLKEGIKNLFMQKKILNV